ncbi:MAG TPA: diacylglycerol kinase [Gammaproteobacteria bacterium]|nr:diacylglycerol kinase [Gammaproteobacteria bacterium]
MAAENRGLLRFIQAARFSWQGLTAAYRFEEAFRQELWLAALLSPIAFILSSNGIELALLLGSLILVLIIELMNSGLEAAVDRIGKEHHELSGRAKDIGSAAVMLALLNVAVIWGCIIFI